MRTASLARALVHVLAAIPLIVALIRWLGPGLGPDPAGWLVRRSGDVALAFLVLSLVPGAVRRLSGDARWLPARRELGLYAFKYAGLHLTGYLWLYFGWQWDLIASSLSANRFAWLGLLTFLIMLPLAVTSTAGWQRRLGRGWQRLHRLAYLAALLDAWHFAYAFKEWRATPIAVGVLVVALLLVRVVRPEARTAVR